MNIEFSDHTNAHRFELRSDEEVVGFLAYQLRDDVITMVHIEVEPAHSGQGHAATLARGALDSARERSLTVVPTCPYVASYITKHPAYADLVAAHG